MIPWGFGAERGTERCSVPRALQTTDVAYRLLNPSHAELTTMVYVLSRVISNVVLMASLYLRIKSVKRKERGGGGGRWISHRDISLEDRTR